MNMAITGIIDTARLRIIPFSEEYLTQDYVGWLNDPEVVRYSEQRFKAHTIESCREYMCSFEGTPNYFWAVVERQQGLGHIGNMNAYLNETRTVADVGILIGEKKAWRQGYGLEAWDGVCRWLFASGVRKITAGALSENAGMVDLMRRAGMVDETPMQSPPGGRSSGIVRMALYRK